MNAYLRRFFKGGQSETLKEKGRMMSIKVAVSDVDVFLVIDRSVR